MSRNIFRNLRHWWCVGPLLPHGIQETLASKPVGRLSKNIGIAFFSRMLAETLGQTSQHRFSTNEEKVPGIP
jgi:hypothetical protein